MNSLIVSLHDVSPLTFAVSRQILEDLRSVGITKTSLLIIPNHHHRGHFMTNPDFCEWMVEMSVKGHEIVAHGYFHERERTVKDSLLTQLMTRIYTADEGEFYDIEEDEALAKMQLAREDFALLDLQPMGFIAPAWLLGEAAGCAAKTTGFRYTTTLREIRDLTNLNPIHISQSLVYSVRSGWRRLVSIGWNRFLLSLLEANPIARLSIHPADWEYPGIRDEILRLAKYLRNRRQPTTYDGWILK